MSMEIVQTVEWFCPSCKLTDTTREARPHSRFHICPRTRYLTVPMVRKGLSAKVVLTEREDYVGKELVRLDPERGRPVQNVTIVRDNGQDCAVFAGTASLEGR